LNCVPGFDNFLLGIEPYISAYNYSSDSFYIGAEHRDSLRRRIHGGVSFRMGYVLPCNFFVYGLVGVDVARFEFQDFVQIDESSASTSKTFVVFFMV
jgi:hypothetical protein